MADYKIYLFRRIKGRYKFLENGKKVRKISKAWRHPKHGLPIGQVQDTAFTPIRFAGNTLGDTITEFGIENLRSRRWSTQARAISVQISATSWVGCSHTIRRLKIPAYLSA